MNPKVNPMVLTALAALLILAALTITLLFVSLKLATKSGQLEDCQKNSVQKVLDEACTRRCVWEDEQHGTPGLRKFRKAQLEKIGRLVCECTTPNGYVRVW